MNLINNIGESNSLEFVTIIDKYGKIKSLISGGGGSATWGTITGTLSTQTDLQSALNAKQDTLVSATNIKTINGSTILGSGDLVVSGSGAAWGSITGTLSSQTDLQSALNLKYDASNPSGYIDASALTPYLTTTTAAATYYPLTNPSGYISGITSGDVTTALGYTPYDSSNPAGYIDSSALTPYLTSSTAAATYYPLTNPSGYITGITSGDVTTALGYTPYDSSNPSGYIDSSALTPYLTSATASATYYPLTNPSGYISGITSGDVTTALGYTPVPDTNTVTINGNTQTLGSNPSFTVSAADPGGWTTIVKSANQDVENNSTPVDDTELQFSVVAGGHYMVELNLCYSGNNTTGNYKWIYAVDNGLMYGRGIATRFTTSGSPSDQAITAPGSSVTGNNAIMVFTNNLDELVTCIATFNFYATANATFIFRFSNNNAAAGRISRTWKGSILKYKRID